jgi:hypothetical protein
VSLDLQGQTEADVHGGSEMVAFRHAASPEALAEIEVNVAWIERLHNRATGACFESGAIWRMFSSANKIDFEFTSPLLGNEPYKRMCADLDFHRVEILLSRAAQKRCGKISPLEYPACELLITNYLALHGLGVEVHGCGVIDRESGGHLFLGHSGAGKSTTARLWESLRAPEILSDDRIILRIHQGELWMYGTPWHGEEAFALPGSAKINRIHILQHGNENRISVIPRARAVGEVFVRCFPPFYNSDGLAGAIDFIKRSLEIVPCYEFNFLPDPSSLAAVLSFHD